MMGLVSNAVRELEALHGCCVGVAIVAYVQESETNPLICADMKPDLVADVLELGIRSIRTGRYDLEVFSTPRGSRLKN